MAEENSKMKGKAQEAAGKVRAAVGETIDDEEMEMKGRAQEAEGKAEQLKGEAQEKAQEAKDKITGN